MKHKYVIISGLAFGEKADMKKLKGLAQRGWILDGLTLFFYRLRKGEPQNIEYSLDYQSEYDEEYFTIFQEAGWTHRATLAAEMHIFSAPEGTVPIYLDTAEQSEQYLPMIKAGAMGSIVSLLILLSLGIFKRLSGASGWMSLVLIIPMLLAWIIFVFNFFPCMGYLFRRIRAVWQGNKGLS
ncbi:MAG TPA: DUF2812 domain-containing protein [Limnochordia bacterium]|nr:DUF2812 domain-containing protein [Limnochordia bacterium]